MTTFGIIFWYLAIGSIAALRAHYRVMIPYKDNWVKKFDKDLGRQLYGTGWDSWDIVQISAAIYVILTWPVRIVKGWKIFFTNRKKFWKDNEKSREFFGE